MEAGLKQEAQGASRPVLNTDILAFFAIFGATFLVVKYLWKRRNFYKSSFAMNGPISFPIIGNGYLLRGTTKDILDKIMMIQRNFKPPIRFWLGPEFSMLIGTPKELEAILNHPLALRKSHLYKFMEPVVGQGLFSHRDINKWKQHRKYIVTTFNQKVLNSYMEVYNEKAHVFVKKVETHAGDPKEFDVFPYFYNMTLDIIGKTILDYDLNQQEHHSEVAEWLEEVMQLTYDRIFNPILHFDVIFNALGKQKRLAEMAVIIRGFLFDILAKKKQEYLALKEQNACDDEHRFRSSMELLIALSEEEVLPDEQIIDELITLMIGGSDSSANIDSFALMMLGMHQDIQEEVYQEIKDIFGDSDRNVTVEDLPHLKLLERVIKETMRLFPIGPIIAREAMEDIDMKTYTIPKGTTLAICIMAVQRDPKIWKDPMVFNPDRFLPENFSKMPPSSYLPFSGGPRNCIGPKFAMMSMKTVLATVLRKYKIFCNYKQVDDIAVKADVMIKAQDGNTISLELRE